MPKNYTYTDAGVNRQQRHESKKALSALKETYRHIGFGGIKGLDTLLTGARLKVRPGAGGQPACVARAACGPAFWRERR